MLNEGWLALCGHYSYPPVTRLLNEECRMKNEEWEFAFLFFSEK